MKYVTSLLINVSLFSQNKKQCTVTYTPLSSHTSSVSLVYSFKNFPFQLEKLGNILNCVREIQFNKSKLQTSRKTNSSLVQYNLEQLNIFFILLKVTK